MRFGALVLGLVVAAGCSAGALPPEALPTVTITPNDIVESEYLALGTAVRDAVALVIPKLLAVQPGAFDPQTQTRGSGTLTISGSVDVPAPRAATFDMRVALDQYKPPKFSSVQAYSDWQFSDGANGPSTMTLSFTDMPTMPLDDLGEISGTFDGGLVVDGKEPGDLDVRLSLLGRLVDNADGKVYFQLLHISGVMTSPAFGSYQNDVPFEPADMPNG